jgi:hypothetical protein
MSKMADPLVAGTLLLPLGACSPQVVHEHPQSVAEVRIAGLSAPASLRVETSVDGRTWYFAPAMKIHRDLIGRETYDLPQRDVVRDGRYIVVTVGAIDERLCSLTPAKGAARFEIGPRAHG